MKGTQDLSVALLAVFTVSIVGAIYGCTNDKALSCKAVNILLSGEMMAVYIIILICFFLALWGDKRNK